MKVCPICKSAAFDDASVCYGCLHPFMEAKHVSKDSRSKLPTRDYKLNPSTLLIAVQAVPTDEGGIEWRWNLEKQRRTTAVPA